MLGSSEYFRECLLSLPEPFRGERFALYREGICDDPDVSVYINDQRDFAFLFPQPRTEYHHYQPRFQRLKLDEYRKRNKVVESRFRKIRPYFEGPLYVLEIGSSDGAFLCHAQKHNSRLRVASLEVDANSKSGRDQISSLEQFSDFSQLVAAARRFDLVCLFHVLEHIIDPASFLGQCRATLGPAGRLIVEVPSLDDPLLTLYQVPEYQLFYFQRQHPYVYSDRSLARLLEKNGFRILRCVRHQRYGLENHLTWLSKRRPGGDETLRSMFEAIDVSYREVLEEMGIADAVIVVAESTR